MASKIGRMIGVLRDMRRRGLGENWGYGGGKNKLSLEEEEDVHAYVRDMREIYTCVKQLMERWKKKIRLQFGLYVQLRYPLLVLGGEVFDGERRFVSPML